MLETVVVKNLVEGEAVKGDGIVENGWEVIIVRVKVFVSSRHV